MPFFFGKPVFLTLGLISLTVLLLSWRSGRIKLFRYKTDVMVVGFTLAIAMSHLSHGYFGGALTSLTEFIPVFVGYFLIAYALDSDKKIRIFILLLIGLVTFLAFESYLQITTGMSHGGLEPLLQRSGFDEDGSATYLIRTRWYGVFNDPNDLGMALILFVPLLIERVYQKRLVLSFLVLPLLIFGLYSTNSRGSILSLAISIFTYLVLRYRSFRGVIFGCILAFLGMIFGPSRMSNMSAGESSAYGRLEAWYQGFQMFKSNPLFGVGEGMFTEYHSLTAHNSYVLVFSELGFFGALFFAGLFFFPLAWGKGRLLQTKTSLNIEVHGVACALMGGLVGIMSSLFFLSRSYVFLPFMLVAIFSAFIGVTENTESKLEITSLTSSINWKLLILIVILQILFINFFLKIFL